MRTFRTSPFRLSSVLVVSPPRPPRPVHRRRKDIRIVGAQIQDAWNKADAKMLADLWLTDGDYVSSTGRTARGRTEVEKAFAEQWATIYKGTKIAHTLTNVHFLRATSAIADGAFEITGMKDASGKMLRHAQRPLDDRRREEGRPLVRGGAARHGPVGAGRRPGQVAGLGSRL